MRSARAPAQKFEMNEVLMRPMGMSATQSVRARRRRTYVKRDYKKRYNH